MAETPRPVVGGIYKRNHKTIGYTKVQKIDGDKVFTSYFSETPELARESVSQGGGFNDIFYGHWYNENAERQKSFGFDLDWSINYALEQREPERLVSNSNFWDI